MNSTYKNAYRLEVLREEMGGFYPNDFIISKFGLESSGANSVFAVSKNHFKNKTGEEFPEKGDLLVFTNADQIFEIKDIDTRDPWISNGKHFYWKMSCLPYENNSDKSISDNIIDFIDADSADLIASFLEENDIYDPEFLTADNECITVDTIFYFADEDMNADENQPLTADREDVDASDDEYWSSSELDINNGNGSIQRMNQMYPDNKNIAIIKDAAKHKTTNSFGFN